MTESYSASPAISYATPTPVSRLGPSVWIALIGLGLIGFGGCFLIGVMALLRPQLLAGPGATATAMTPGVIALMIVLYGAAFACFGGAVALVLRGVKSLFAMIS